MSFLDLEYDLNSSGTLHILPLSLPSKLFHSLPSYFGQQSCSLSPSNAPSYLLPWAFFARGARPGPSCADAPPLPLLDSGHGTVCSVQNQYPPLLLLPFAFIILSIWLAFFTVFSLVILFVYQCVPSTTV